MWWNVNTIRCRSGAVRITAVRKVGGAVRLQTAVRSAAPTCWICSSQSRSSYRHGATGLAVDDRVHSVVQKTAVEWAGDGHVELHRIQVTEIRSGAGVEEQSLLEGSQRQDVGDAV